jgi:hypothetical protein
MKPKVKGEYTFMARQKGALSYKQLEVFKPHYKVIFISNTWDFRSNSV